MVAEFQQLVVELCQSLHSKGSALIPGTGVALKQGDQVFVPPSDVHLDRLEREDIFTFNCDFDSAGNPEINPEATNPCHNISAYTKLFLKLFQDFDCGCVFYAQPTSAIVVGELFDKFYKIKNNQLITQISNGETKEQYHWTHELKIPIIINPDDQTNLFAKLEKAFEANPQTNAVIIKGNGLFVCGDTWQETKLMFETFLQLFEVSIELEKVGKLRPDQDVAAPIVKKAKPAESKFIDLTKPARSAQIKPTIKPRVPVKRSADVRTRTGGASIRIGRENISGRDNYDLALRRKKVALARLRVNNSGPGDSISGGRMNAASFMQNNGTNQHFDNSYQSMAMGNGTGMNMGMGTGDDMTIGMNQGNNMNMNMNQGDNMNMGMNQMNNMNNMNTNMNQSNNMMQGSVNMGMGNGGMMGMGNQGNMNMNMNQEMFNNGMGDGVNQGYMHGMEDGGMGTMNRGMNIDMREGRSSGLYGSLARGRGSSRGNRSMSPRRGKGFSPRGGRGASRGNVKERLGFKSNISVDPSELTNLDVNEEDY